MALDFFPQSYATTPQGVLIITDGINAVRRWDGLASTTDTAGVIPPATALTVRSAGRGPIIGEYTAYSRFKDSRENLSNLSPISDAFRTYTTGTIVTATNTTPIAIGSVAHGLNTGDKVRITNVMGNTAANGNWTIKVHDENNYSLNGSVGNGAHTANTGTWVGGVTTPPGRGIVTTATNTTPIAIGSFAHGLQNGDTVFIRGVLGNTAANGQWTITFIDANNYSLNGSAGNGAHTANTGYWTSNLVNPSAGTILLATNTSPINIGSVAHGQSTGTSVRIERVEGNTAANGTFTITVVDDNNFTLDGSTGNGGYSGGGTWVGGSGPPFFSAAISGATNATPIVITSAAHGLVTDDRVTVTGVQGNTSANGTWDVFRVDADTFQLVDSAGNAAYTAGTGTWTAGARAFLYTSVPLSSETKVTTRQVLRNTDGQADTYYVDVETTDLVDTSLESTFDDAEIVSEEAVPILDEDGGLLANLYDVPPDDKAVAIAHLGRMFYLVERTVRQGACQVTNGSTTVTGIGTKWKTTFADRILYVVGSTRSYTISSVDEANQTLTLTESYAGTTDLFAVYAIRPNPARRRVIMYSEAGLPEAVPAQNEIELDDNDDELTGAMQSGSYLYFLERHHTWRFSMIEDPAADGRAWPMADRGCINDRCHITVEGEAYLLDSDGIYVFRGGADIQPVGNAIQDLFRPSDADFQLNLQAAEYFHAAHYPNQETIRWFIAFSGQDFPRNAIVFNYRQKRWWIEEYSRPITASTTGDLNGRRVVYLGSDAKKTLALWQGTTDGPDPAKGTVRGTVTSATALTLTDSTATYPSTGVVANPVLIVDGPGKGQIRRISAVSGTTLIIKDPWLILPTEESTYQLGGINWTYQTGFFRLVESEDNEPTRLELIFQPQAEEGTLDMQIFRDFSQTPVNLAVGKSSEGGTGVRTTVGEPEMVVDLTKANGHVQQRLDRHRDIYLNGPHYLSVELSGTTTEEQTRIYQLTIDGAAA